MSNDRLQTTWIYAIDLSNNSDIFILVFILRDDHIRRRMMLFITHQYVRYQRTFTRQKGDSHFHCFSMPVLWIFTIKKLVLNLFFQLMEEPVLSAHAKVTNCKETHLLKNKFSWKFQLYCCLTQEVLQSQWWNLHNIANVETVYPLTLIQIAKNVLHVWNTTIVKSWSWLRSCVRVKWISVVHCCHGWCYITLTIWWYTSSSSFR